MFVSTGVLIALIALTIALAIVFLVRSSVTGGIMGKILAFVGLCVLPVLCIGTGWSVQEQRSEQTSSCIACHSMESHGKSLYLADASYIPAQHFQNHLVPPDKACYTCHTDYATYGSLKDKLRGLKYIYMQYVSTPPKIIRVSGGYSNLQCLHCHAGARGFSDNPAHAAIMGSLTTNQISCLTCHDMIHNASEVGHLKMWVPGNAPASLADASSSSAPTKAEPAATAGSVKVPTGSSGGGATTATTRGKNVFDSHGCAGCHGESGGGGAGPALTHISGQYPPAKLTAVLEAPTAKMKAAGMIALKVNAADMKALVSYVTSLGGTSAAPAVTPDSASSSPAPAKAEPPAAAGPSKAATVATPPGPGTSTPAPAKAEPAATAGPSKAPTGSPAGNASATQGKGIFDSQRCSGCHGASGGGGVGPALTHISSQYPPAQLEALLKAPSAKMTAAGMVPLTLNDADMKALVAYVTSLGGTSAGSSATPPAVASPSSAKAKTEPAATAAPSKPESKGQAVFKAHGCADCHGTGGVGGTAAAPALAGAGKSVTPALLTTMLQHPTARMQQGGMPPISLSSDELKALAEYVSSISGSKNGDR